MGWRLLLITYVYYDTWISVYFLTLTSSSNVLFLTGLTLLLSSQFNHYLPDLGIHCP